jgi:hypothetical protein
VYFQGTLRKAELEALVIALSPYRLRTGHLLQFGFGFVFMRRFFQRRDTGPFYIVMADSTQSEFVTLVSCDGFEFIIPRSAACISGTIRRMLDPASTLSYDSVLRKLPKIPG